MVPSEFSLIFSNVFVPVNNSLPEQEVIEINPFSEEQLISLILQSDIFKSLPLNYISDFENDGVGDASFR